MSMTGLQPNGLHPFKIAPLRGSAVLLAVLGEEFDGVLGCDSFSAYRQYMGECGVRVQFCLGDRPKVGHRA